MKGNSNRGHMSLRALKKAGASVCGREVYVQYGCVIDSGAKIYAPCHILNGTHICGGATVLPCSYIENSYVGRNAIVRQSTLIGAYVGDNTSVGPYAYLREGAKIGKNCRIGDFVEIKASVVGDGTKVAHLAYVGDAEIGAGVNVGCGVVFANYDGNKKHKTVVGDGCFIGCNCNIVAPVTIKKGAYVAAGTTLTKDLQEDDFCIARCRERVKPHGACGRYKNG